MRNEEPSEPVFQIQSGRAGCSTCLGEERSAMPLCSQSLSALRYILLAEPKKILSYSLDEKSLTLLANVTERYLISRLEREFSTPKFYKSLF